MTQISSHRIEEAKLGSATDKFREHLVSLRNLTCEDLVSVVGVHMDSFPSSALSRLGRSTVERYYRWQLEGPHEKVWAVGAFLDGACVGFSFSGAFSGSTSGFIRKNRQHLVGSVLFRPWLVFSPLFFERLRSGLKLLFVNKENKKRPRQRNEEKGKSFGILSIAVAGNYQKLGIGKILMLDAEREAAECNYGRMHLTVSPKNGKAIRFYERLGWVRQSENGNWRGLMVKSLPTSPKVIAHGSAAKA